MSELPDPQTDNARVTDSAKKVRPEWLIMIGVTPISAASRFGNKPGQDGPFGGWFCPCHGSAYDTSGRIRQDPRRQPLGFRSTCSLSDALVRIG